MQEALRLILQAEAAAREVVVEAKVAARELEHVADEQTRKLQEVALSAAQKRADETRAMTNEAVAKKEGEIRTVAQREINLLSQNAVAHMSEAVQLVVNSVLGLNSS